MTVLPRHAPRASAVPQTGRDARLAIRTRRSSAGQTAGVAPGYRAGQSRHPAGRAGRRFPALLPAQSEAVPAARGLGARRLSAADARPRTSTSAPTCRATACSGDGEAGRRAAPTSARIGATISSAFVLGCSFSFEEALIEDGIELRHMTCGRHGADVSHLDCDRRRRARSTARMVVSMRPMKPADAIRAIQITTRFPAVHGAPVHIGKPELIGIADLVQARLWRRGADQRRRDPGVLGLRRDAAIGGGDGEAGILHHPLSRQHAGDRPAQRRIRDHVTRSLVIGVGWSSLSVPKNSVCSRSPLMGRG